MVTRTAFVRLRRSNPLVALSIVGMMFLYLLPPIALIYGINNADLTVVVFGAAGWSVMAVSIVPTLKLYGLHAAYSVLLPVAGCLYGVMTVSSALRDRRGKGGA